MEENLKAEERSHYDAENVEVGGAQGSEDSAQSDGPLEKAIVDNGREEI